MNLKDIYNEVYYKVIREDKDILDKKKGVLYSTISLLFDEYYLKDPQDKTAWLCKQLKIQNNSPIKKDLELAITILTSLEQSLIPMDMPIPKSIPEKGLEVKNRLAQSILNDNNILLVIVICACVLVGAYVCLKYLNRKNSKSARMKGQKASSPDLNIYQPVISSLQPAVLCLIVPGNVASVLPPKININQLKDLIDSASYFLCVKKDEKVEDRLNLTNEPIPTKSQKEVFVKVELSNGMDLIGKTTRYEIKSNLNESIVCEIQTVKCLKNLSGLESFIRI